MRYAITLLLALLGGCQLTETQAKPDNRPEVIAFSASWCGPCHAARPQVDALEKSGVKVTRFDADRDAAEVARYRVARFPTFLVIVRGKVKARLHDVRELVRTVRAK